MPTNLKRAFLRDAYDQSAGATPATSLFTKLRAWESTARSSTSTGFFLQSTSRNNAAGGQSAGLAYLNEFNIVQILDMLEELVTMFEEEYVNLGGTPTDAEVKVEMLARLKPCYEHENDFSQMLVGRGAPV